MDQKVLQRQFRDCMPLFIALGDQIRLSIIELLADHFLLADAALPGMDVNQITQKLNLSRPAISHHLKILKDTGLIGCTKSGTHNYYYLTISESTRQLMTLGEILQSFLKTGKL